MITDVAARERYGDERAVRAAVGLQQSAWSRIGGFFAAVIGFVAGLLGFLVVTVSLTCGYC